MQQNIKRYAKMTIAALKNEHNTCIHVNSDCFAQVCEYTNTEHEALYFGAKNTAALKPLISKLQGNAYFYHTIDALADNGRAIDIKLRNPLTDRAMSGSSSGSAINVFYGINDIGIGSDGGGSVLAPAMSLNLFSLISPLLPITQLDKISTDGIKFAPVAGIIAHNFKHFIQTVEYLLLEKKPKPKAKISILCQENFTKLDGDSNFQVTKMPFPDINGPRAILIAWCTQKLKLYDIIISEEGPIDCLEYGDTLQGIFSEKNTKEQQKAGKGLLRIVAMSKATAITIPKLAKAEGYVLIANSTPRDIYNLLEVGKIVEQPFPEIIKKYFHQSYNKRENNIIF
ncbi:hypothetical protein AwErysi_00090 [Erysipelotrichaceae bacterium]|nr:hypothetical protein AwErysi_00090 [Erysipelotrichaceae bacterium]